MKLSLVASALVLPMISLTALAEETVLPDVTGGAEVIQLTDSQLDTVRGLGKSRWGKRKGGKWGGGCYGCFEINTANVTQLNISLGSYEVAQFNDSYISQRN